MTRNLSPNPDTTASVRRNAVIGAQLAERFRELAPSDQVTAVVEWMRAADNMTAALKRARRACAERDRLRKLQGRKARLEVPGVSGLIFDQWWDFVVEGARVGAARELGTDDVPALVEAFQALQRAVLGLVLSNRSDRQHARLGLRRHSRAVDVAAVAPLFAVAHGYGRFRGTVGGPLGVFEVSGKEKPAAKIAAIALARLGHSHASIARVLSIDPRDVRGAVGSARGFYAANP